MTLSKKYTYSKRIYYGSIIIFSVIESISIFVYFYDPLKIIPFVIKPTGILKIIFDILYNPIKIMVAYFFIWYPIFYKKQYYRNRIDSDSTQKILSDYIESNKTEIKNSQKPNIIITKVDSVIVETNNDLSFGVTCKNTKKFTSYITGFDISINNENNTLVLESQNIEYYEIFGSEESKNINPHMNKPHESNRHLLKNNYVICFKMYYQNDDDITDIKKQAFRVMKFNGKPEKFIPYNK